MEVFPIHKTWFAPGGAGDHENEIISEMMGFRGENEMTTGLKDPGEFVEEQSLQRDTDVQIVTVEEGGKYSEGRFD